MGRGGHRVRNRGNKEDATAYDAGDYLVSNDEDGATPMNQQGKISRRCTNRMSRAREESNGAFIIRRLQDKEGLERDGI